MKVFITVLLLSLSVWARLTDNQVDIAIENEQIKVSTKKGFHLNVEAPASAVFDNLEALYQPTTKTEKLFVFKKINNTKSVNLSFYVCDDKKTVCEQHQQTLNLKSGAVKKSEIKANYSNIKEINLASKDGRPTLLVFSAPWCPACIRMQTETYHVAPVEKQLAKINFVKLNSDVAENLELSEKFKVKAIPTLILLDRNGNETYRWLDFQPAQSFAKSLAVQIKKVDLAEALTKNAQMGDAKAASELGFRAFNTLDYAQAFKWFSLTKSERDLNYKLASEVSLAQENAEEDEKLTPDYIQALEKGIALSTSKLDKIRWTVDLLSKKSEQKLFTEESTVKAKKTVAEIEKLIAKNSDAVKAFKDSTYGEYGGFETAELLWLQSKLYSLMDMKLEKAKTDERTRELLDKKKLSISRPGEMLLAIAYLREAGEVKKVESLYEQLTKQYPSTYVYFEKYARFLLKNKNLEKALALTDEALKFPEGNEAQLSLLKTQILKDLNRKKEALNVIESTLKLEDINHKKFTRTVKKLNELKEDLQKTN